MTPIEHMRRAVTQFEQTGQVGELSRAHAWATIAIAEHLERSTPRCGHTEQDRAALLTDRSHIYVTDSTVLGCPECTAWASARRRAEPSLAQVTPPAAATADTTKPSAKRGRRTSTQDKSHAAAAPTSSNPATSGNSTTPTTEPATSDQPTNAATTQPAHAKPTLDARSQPIQRRKS